MSNSPKVGNYSRLVILLFLLVFISSSYLLGWSSLFTVKNIVINGSTAKGEILNKLRSDSIAPELGAKLARVQIRSIDQSLTQLNWLNGVLVDRNWLEKTIVIEVTEKNAVAKAVTNEGEVVNFDQNGAVFNPTSLEQLNYQEKLPLIRIQSIGSAQLEKVASLFTAIPEGMRELITNMSSMTVSNSGFTQMQTQISGAPIQIKWGEIEEIELKCKVLAGLLKLPENKSIKRVDLSQPNLPIVS
jgi:cell division septal protein FtsQ